MLKVGLTGGIGSGKTAVSDLFVSLGIPVIDTDVIAHALVNNDQQVIKEIVSKFGVETLDQTGHINRKKLAQLIFNNESRKHQLENILHPKIRIEVFNQIQKLKKGHNSPQYVIIVIPLLLETDFTDLVDRILVVIADEKIRIERVKQRDNRSLDEIQAIISHQVNDDMRLTEADDILENNKDFKGLESKVRQLHIKYMRISSSSK